jgi:hypothetical protein
MHVWQAVFSQTDSSSYLISVQPLDFDEAIVTHIYHGCRVPKAFPGVSGRNWVIRLVDLLRSSRRAVVSFVLSPFLLLSKARVTWGFSV